MTHPVKTPDTSQRRGSTLLLAGSILGTCLLVGYLLFFYSAGDKKVEGAQRGRLTLAQIPFDGAKAMDNLKAIVALGSRMSGTKPMEEQQKLLEAHFTKQGAKVELQKFEYRHPQTGQPVPMANMIVKWHPERKQRVMICAHYDTRPFPDRDERNPRGKFLGANDGASGVGLLMELGRHMLALKGEVGVDFVFFDGEEFVFGDDDPYFVGSEHFANAYAKRAADQPTYRAAVLLDMVGDANLQIFQEVNMMSWADTRPLANQIWTLARGLGVNEFVARPGYEVRDDHIALHDVGRIPTVDLIDFDYPAWHTQDDLPDRCSALSLAKVGWVVHEWLKQATTK